MVRAVVNDGLEGLDHAYRDVQPVLRLYFGEAELVHDAHGGCYPVVSEEGLGIGDLLVSKDCWKWLLNSGFHLY